MATEFSKFLVHGLPLLMSWRIVGDYRAQVVHRLGDESTKARSYLLEARPRELSYRLINVDTGKVDSFEWATRRRIEHSVEVEESVSSITPEPLAARLAFPTSLAVWGRNIDDYRFTGDAVEQGHILRLGLVHTSVGHLTGSLDIDTRRRQAVRLDTPMHFLAYENIEPLS